MAPAPHTVQGSFIFFSFGRKILPFFCTVYFWESPDTSLAKASKEYSSLEYPRSSSRKKQLGISFAFRFLLMHGAHPFPCRDGCKGHAVSLQVQNLLKLLSIVSSRMWTDHALNDHTSAHIPPDLTNRFERARSIFIPLI